MPFLCRHPAANKAHNNIQWTCAGGEGMASGKRAVLAPQRCSRDVMSAHCDARAQSFVQR